MDKQKQGIWATEIQIKGPGSEFSTSSKVVYENSQFTFLKRTLNIVV